MDPPMTKTCYKCKGNIPFANFYKSAKSNDGYWASCKDCSKSEQIQINKSEFDKLATQNKKKCKGCNEIKDISNFQNDPRMKLGVKSKCGTCTQDIKRNYVKDKKINDPRYKRECKLRIRLRNLVKNNISGKTYKGNSYNKFIGCTVNQLVKYLESKFTENMSWKNHGEWHIDHIEPCTIFNLLDEKEQQRCFHYTNLQPLWGIDNIKKGKKLNII